MNGILKRLAFLALVLPAIVAFCIAAIAVTVGVFGAWLLIGPSKDRARGDIWLDKIIYRPQTWLFGLLD